MDVGIQTIFASHGWDGMTDAQVYDEDTRLALLAADLGFDVVWAVEHHFFDYSFCPDNVAWLSYIAGRHETVGLGTAAVIMPWNDPLRVAERIALLDQVSGGRVRFGMGRGLSRREFANFGAIEMDGVARALRRELDDGQGGAGDRLDRGPRDVLRAAPGADPPGAGEELRRPPVRGGVVGRLDRGGGPAEGADDDVLGPLVGVAQAEHRPLGRPVPRAPRRGAAAAAGVRLRLLLGRSRRRARPAVHGRLPAVGPRALRDPRRPLRGPEGLRRLRQRGDRCCAGWARPGS